jgi:hypothetical protein
MRWLIVIVLAMVQTATLPPAYPRPGATLMLENARVLVWNISWLKQQYPLHRHLYDLVGVYYAPGDRIIVSTDGNRRPVSTKAWETATQNRGVTHVEEGASDRPLRAVFLELKEPAANGQVEAPSMTAAFPQAGGTQLRDTERAVVWEFAPAPPAVSHRHLRDAVAVAFEGETPRVAFIAKGTVHTEEMSGRSDRLYVFELK